MPDQYTNQLSAYLDDELEGSERVRLTAHLSGCAECAALLADLRAIVAAAPGYGGRQPTRDLWKGIEARLGEPEVIPIDTVRSTRPSPRRFGWRELIAASLLMAAVGGGAVYLALRPADSSANPPLAAAPDTSRFTAPEVPSSRDSRNVEFAERKYDSAVRDLELVLDAGRSRLDTATVRSVEESLRKIDSAIAEARAAIQRDPANAYLNRQIAANMRRKLDLLRIATNAIAART